MHFVRECGAGPAGQRSVSMLNSIRPNIIAGVAATAWISITIARIIASTPSHTLVRGGIGKRWALGIKRPHLPDKGTLTEKSDS